MEPTQKLKNYCFAAVVSPDGENLNPHCLRVGLSTGGVNNDEGQLSDVSILTATEAKGHGILVDDIALAGALELLKGTRCPAFVTHSGAHWRDRMLEQVGFFEGFTIQGDQLKAKTFQALQSFREHDKAACDRLFDVAANMPETFGVSIVFNGFLAWVASDGTETPVGEEGRPAGLKYGLPCVRFTEITSADFVDAPAANPNGLLETARELSNPPNQPINEKEKETMKKFDAEQIGKLEGLPPGFAAILGAIAADPEAFKKLDDNPDALAALTGDNKPGDNKPDDSVAAQLSEIQNKLSALEKSDGERATALASLSTLLGAPPAAAPDTSGDHKPDEPKGGELSAADKLKGKTGKELVAAFNKNKAEILANL